MAALRVTASRSALAPADCRNQGGDKPSDDGQLDRQQRGDRVDDAVLAAL
jgi:hypothetical protein